MDSTTPDDQTTTTTTATTTSPSSSNTTTTMGSLADSTVVQSVPSETTTTAPVGSPVADNTVVVLQSVPSEDSFLSSPTTSSSFTSFEENTDLNAPTLASSTSSAAASSAAATTDAATLLDDASTSTEPIAPAEGSTTIDVYVIPSDYSCPRINDTYAVVNNSDVREGTVVSVTCRSPAKLVTLPANKDVFTCNGAHWRPLTPSCRLDADSSAPVGIIVGCTLGGVVCLVLVAVAIFLMFRSMKERKIQQERNHEYDEKMDIICLYVNSKFEDVVGMPVMTMDTRDTGLRGRDIADEQSTSEHHNPKENEAGNLDADLF